MRRMRWIAHCLIAGCVLAGSGFWRAASLSGASLGVPSPLAGSGFCWVASLQAQPPKATVQLELVGDARGAALSFQDWARALDQAGIRNVRLRSALGNEKVGVQLRGTAQRPIYLVTGQVLSAEELLLPPGRFRRSDLGRLAQWLDDLARYGPEESRPPRGAFGLTADQYQAVLQDTARPVGFSTQGKPRAEVVRQVVARLGLPLQWDAQAAAGVGSDAVAEELEGLSCGTALACLLRPAGLCLVPRPAPAGPAYGIVAAAPELEIWPVGWEPKQPVPKLLPALYEFRNIHIQGVSAKMAVEEIGRRLQVPVLWDHNALARWGLEPEKVQVALPQSRTTYSQALGKLLFQAQLKFEVRVDEGDHPFLWITSIKPL